MGETYRSLLERISGDLGLLPDHLNIIFRTAPLRYKKYVIKKRNGGDRLVAQPAKEVKAIQYWLMENVLDKLPIHDAALAYRNGKSIKQNALLHSHSNFMLKVDFKSFFPSIKKTNIKQHVSFHLGGTLEQDSVEMISHILSWAPTRRAPLELCIGAPSSPLISNSIMYAFDEILNHYATENILIYSRYADDITISSLERGKLDLALTAIRETIHALAYPKLQLNEGKTVFASRRSRRVVTGLVLTPDLKISLGRERKRTISSMYHHYILGKLPEDKHDELNGLLAFAESIEPGFRAKLIKKHSMKENGV